MRQPEDPGQQAEASEAEGQEEEGWMKVSSIVFALLGPPAFMASGALLTGHLISDHPASIIVGLMIGRLLAIPCDIRLVEENLKSWTASSSNAEVK